MKENSVSSWMGKIKRAERVRNQADSKFGYTRSQNEYQNDFASAMPSFISDVDIIPINEVYSFVKSFIPSVYSSDPHITVNPKGRKNIASSKIAELVLNSYWRELRLKREIRRCILDSIFAEGYIKVGYTSVFGTVTNKKTPLESDDFIRDEEIFALRVSWRNIVRDTDAVNGLHDARWMSQNIIKPIEAVRNSTIYDGASDLEPSFTVRPDASGTTLGLSLRSGVEAVENEYASLWEIWDRDSRMVYTVSENHQKFLMKKKWPYDIDGFPFELLRFNENPDEPYAPNMIGSWEPQLWEKMKIRAMEMDHIKRFSRQLWAEEGSVSRGEMLKYQKGKTGAVNFFKKGKQPPQPNQYPPIQTDIYAVEGRIDLDKDNVSGQPNAIRGAPQKTQSRTLGEINRMISSFQARQTEPQSIIEDFSEEIAYKIFKVIQQHLPAEKFIRASQEDLAVIKEKFIDADTGNQRFDETGFIVTKEDIQNVEFDIEVKIGSTVPLDRQHKIESLIEILKLGPSIGIQPGDKLSLTIGKDIISEFDMKSVELAYAESIKDIQNQRILQREAQRLKAQAGQESINSLSQRINQGNGRTIS